MLGRIRYVRQGKVVVVVGESTPHMYLEPPQPFRYCRWRGFMKGLPALPLGELLKVISFIKPGNSESIDLFASLIKGRDRTIDAGRLHGVTY